MTLISPEMTVLDIVAKFGNTQAVFKSYDTIAGECICCNALFDSLQQMATKYSLDLDTLLSDIETAAKKR